eukprot:2433019-Pleurochrysis_carterae.AAC.3
MPELNSTARQGHRSDAQAKTPPSLQGGGRLTEERRQRDGPHEAETWRRHGKYAQLLSHSRTILFSQQTIGSSRVCAFSQPTHEGSPGAARSARDGVCCAMGEGGQVR